VQGRLALLVDVVWVRASLHRNTKWKLQDAAFPVITVSPARTVVAPPSSVVKCLWGVFVWRFGVLFVSCVCVSVSGVLFSAGVCVCVCV